MSQHQGHSADGKIMSMKNYKVTIGNRTLDLTTYNNNNNNNINLTAIGFSRGGSRF